jgi:hypothetical protein
MATLHSRLIGAVSYVARAESRWPAPLRARMERVGAPPVKVSLRNVSRSGFMALSAEKVKAGSMVTIFLPLGPPIRAEVRWAFNDRFGCRLEDQFDNRQLWLLFAAGLVNALLSPAGLRFTVIGACIAMYLIA